MHSERGSAGRERDKILVNVLMCVCVFFFHDSTHTYNIYI
jgi:hypothetical protein